MNKLFNIKTETGNFYVISDNMINAIEKLEKKLHEDNFGFPDKRTVIYATLIAKESMDKHIKFDYSLIT